MENTDVFTSEDDGLGRRKFSGFSRIYAVPNTPSRKIQLFRGNSQTMKTSIHTNISNLIEAVSINNFEKVKEFIRAGHNLIIDKDGKSPIHIAAENGQYEILKYLLQAFPMYNVNTPDNYDNTPLHKAASIGQIDIIQILLERGAQVNIQDSTHGNTPLHEAAWKGYSQTVEYLCQIGRLPNLVNYSLFTPLHLAVQGGHNQTTRNLIKCGADINAQNRFGDTPLHTGVRYGHAGVSRILISVSSDINQQNQNGDTSLHIAAALKRRKITKLLVESGANLDIRNIQNETPLDVAIKKNHSEIIDILKMSICSSNQKTVSFLPENIRENFSVQSRHVSIPNEMCSVVNSPEQKPFRAKSESPHEKIKPTKKTNIVKGFFGRKKKDKSDKVDKSQKKPKENSKPPPSQAPVNKSILCTSISNSRRNSNFNSSIKQESPITRINPVSGIINTYQPQLGSQYFKDLAGNIKQGPIGYMPIPNNSTCNCSQNQNKRSTNQFYPSNVCMDHGYIDYHGSLNQTSNKPYNDGPLLSRNPEKSKDNFESVGHPLTRAKSDESLNQSEHKSRMQEERIKQALNSSHMKNSPVKGRKQNVENNNWNFRQNSLVRPIKLDPNQSKISVQVPQKPKDFRESKDMIRNMMRPSPDGQTDSITSPISEHPRYKVDWRAGKYRPDKIFLPPSKV